MWNLVLLLRPSEPMEPQARAGTAGTARTRRTAGSDGTAGTPGTAGTDALIGSALGVHATATISGSSQELNVLLETVWCP